MALYVIERSFADQLDLTDDDVELIEEINSDEGVRWLFSFLSADRRRSYRLYEAPSPDAILAAARKANVPADVVVEVSAATPQFSDRLRDWPTPSTELSGHGTSPEREESDEVRAADSVGHDHRAAPASARWRSERVSHSPNTSRRGKSGSRVMRPDRNVRSI